MKTHRIALSALVLSLAFPSAGLALVLEDNFDRPGPTPGTDWTASTGSIWELSDNRLIHRQGGTGAADEVLFYNAFSLADTPSFTAMADMVVNRNTGWGGLAFNIIDSQNFYAFRIRPSNNAWQVIRVTDGATALMQTGSNGTVGGDGISNAEAYRFVVHSPSVSQYEVYLYTIESDGSTGGSLANYSFSHSVHAGQGYAGFFAVRNTDTDVLFADNFSLQVIPEPSTVAAFMGAGALLVVLARRRMRPRQD